MRRRTKADAGQFALPLEYAPPRIRARVRELPIRPRVALAARDNGTFTGLRQVSPEEAWSWPEVEFVTANSLPVLAVKVDGAEAVQRVYAAQVIEGLPPFSWMAAAGSDCHVAWTLARPVLQGAHARRKPLRALSRVSEFYASALKADVSFLGEISHNPEHSRFKTTWGRREPYQLADLGRIIPFGWRVPAKPRTGIARRVALWETTMRWAGREANRDVEVLPAVLAANRQFERPLSPAHCRSIARWVEAARWRWAAAGWHTAGFRERQSSRGRRSGAVRFEGSIEQAAPWVAAGISRRTWYRRRAREHCQTALVL